MLLFLVLVLMVTCVLGALQLLLIALPEEFVFFVCLFGLVFN